MNVNDLFPAHQLHGATSARHYDIYSGRGAVMWEHEMARVAPEPRRWPGILDLIQRGPRWPVCRKCHQKVQLDTYGVFPMLRDQNGVEHFCQEWR